MTQSVRFEARDVLVGRAPIPAEVVNVAAEESVQLHHCPGAGIAEGSRAESTVAVHFGGDALLELAVPGWLDQEAQIRVGVHIDETGAHDAPRNVDPPACVSRR